MIKSQSRWHKCSRLTVHVKAVCIEQMLSEDRPSHQDLFRVCLRSFSDEGLHPYKRHHTIIYYLIFKIVL